MAMLVSTFIFLFLLDSSLSQLQTGPPVCPEYELPAECPDQIENFCYNDTSCPAGLKCCDIGCELDCVEPEPGLVVTATHSALRGCPKVDPYTANCPPGLEQLCLADNDCSESQKCCPMRQGGCELQCTQPIVFEGRPRTLDLALLIDASGSISRRKFIKFKKFLERLVDEFDISEDGTHVALIEYSTDASVQLRFNDFSGAQLNAANAKRAINRLPHTRGFTYIDKALALADREVFSEKGGMRPNVQKRCVVITDGVQTVPVDDPRTSTEILRDAVAPIKDKGILVVSVGIGEMVSQIDLVTLATDYTVAFLAETFEALDEIKTKIKEANFPRGPPVCPTFERPAECPDEVANFCHDNNSCPIGLKCCNTGCEIDCVEPEPGPYIIPTGIPSVFQIDYSFVMDTSGCSNRNEFRLLKTFIKQVIDHLNVSSSLTRVGLITFSSRAEMKFSFRSSYDKEEIKRRVDRVPLTGGFTRIDLALKVAKDQLFTAEGGLRRNSRKVMVLLTDGRQTIPQLAPYQTPLVDAIRPIKNLGVKVIAIGIGHFVDRSQLAVLATDSDHILRPKSFTELLEFVEKTVAMSGGVATTAPSKRLP